MSECAYSNTCRFFEERMANMPGMAQMLRGRYCEANSAECARHIVASEFGIQEVPSDLFPNQAEVAELILHQLRTA